MEKSGENQGSLPYEVEDTGWSKQYEWKKTRDEREKAAMFQLPCLINRHGPSKVT